MGIFKPSAGDCHVPGAGLKPDFGDLAGLQTKDHLLMKGSTPLQTEGRRILCPGVKILILGVKDIKTLYEGTITL